MTASVRPAAGVRFDRIAEAGAVILLALTRVASRYQTDLLITSGTDFHTPPDPHSTGEAYDVSVSGMTPEQLTTIYETLRAMLGPLFTVLYEVPRPPSDPSLLAIAYVNEHATGPHLHIQRKKNTVYPPSAELLHA